MITSDDELAKVAARVSADLQAIQNYLGERNCEQGRIRFPRGFIRRAENFRNRFWFLGSEVLRRNLAYSFIASDVFRWILNRTTLVGVAKEMMIKEVICLMAAITESITKEYLKGQISNKKGYKERTAKLVELNIIDENIRDELNWLWDKRETEHIFLAEEREHGLYQVRDSNRAVRVVQALIEKIDAYETENIPF